VDACFGLLTGADDSHASVGADAFCCIGFAKPIRSGQSGDVVQSCLLRSCLGQALRQKRSSANCPIQNVFASFFPRNRLDAFCEK